MVLLVAPIPVAAQDNNSTVGVSVDANDPTDNRCEAPEPIDSNTALCSASYNGDRVVLVLKSDRTQRVTLTDAGAFMEGGVVNRQRFVLREGELNTVRLRATKVNGYVGVSVDTGDTLFAVPIETSSPIIGGPWSASDAQAAGVGGALSVSLTTFMLVFRRLRGRDTEAERVA